MALLWLGFMTLFLVALGIPLVQRSIYATGHAGLLREIVEGFVAYILEVTLFTALMGLAGFLVGGAGGALALGLTGLTASFFVVGILGTVSALRDRGVTEVE